MIKTRNNKRSAIAFAFTLSICLLSFSLIYGLSVSYVNTSNAIRQQPIEIIEISQTSFENAELYVFGAKYNIKMKNEDPIPPVIYALIPFNIKTLFSCFEYIADEY